MGLFKLYFYSQIFFLLLLLPSFLKFPYSTYDVLLYWNEVFLLQRLLIQPWDCVDAKKNLLSVRSFMELQSFPLLPGHLKKCTLRKIFRFDTFRTKSLWKNCTKLKDMPCLKKHLLWGWWYQSLGKTCVTYCDAPADLILRPLRPDGCWLLNVQVQLTFPVLVSIAHKDIWASWPWSNAAFLIE